MSAQATAKARRPWGRRRSAPSTGAPFEAAVRLERAEAQIAGRVVWSDVGIEIARGEYVAILGPNGSGKTTLLRVLLGELPLARGTASVLEKPAGVLKAQIGYLPQRRHLDAGSRIRGVDVVRL
jgi:zinc/manganese transport system ATP-binding protein